MQKLLLALMLGSIMGCQSQSPNPESDFLKAFQQAHAQKNLNAAMKLVYWEGVEPDIKKSVEDSFKDDFALEIEKLEMVAPSENQMTQYTKAGRTFKTNLDVKKVLVVNFKAQVGLAQVHNTKYLIGEKDGKYYITTAVRVG